MNFNSAKERNKFLKEVALQYNCAFSKSIRDGESLPCFFSEEVIDYSTSFISDEMKKSKNLCFIVSVKMILDSLKGREKEILLNDYFDIKDKDWWKEKYSRAKYFRAKKSACVSFLKMYYDEQEAI